MIVDRQLFLIGYVHIFSYESDASQLTFQEFGLSVRHIITNWFNTY